MNEITILITLDEYRDLVKQAEIIETVKRYIEQSKYVSLDDVKIILDIRERATMGAKENG